MTNEDKLQMLIAEGTLNSIEAGITAIVLNGEVDQLSDKQRQVFEKYVVGKYLKTHCDTCGEEVPLEDVVSFDGTCRGCHAGWAKTRAPD